MIHPNDKFRFISHNKQREVIGSSASVEELMFSCGEEITVTMYDDSDGTFKCNEIPNNSQSAPSVSNNQNSKIKRHK